MLLVGLGAVSTTTIAGIMAVRKGIAKPIGALTQMGTIRLGKRTDNRSPLIPDFVPLAGLDQLVFGGWDIFEDDCYEAAKTAGVLETSLLDQIKGELTAVKPMPAVFDRQYVKRLDGPNVKKGKNKKDLAEQLISDIRRFKTDNGLDRVVLLWCGSTEIFLTESPAHQSLAAFEKGLEDERPVDSVEHDLRLRGDSRRPAVRERRAESLGRHSGADRARAEDRIAARRQGSQDRTDADQDDHRAGPQGAADWHRWAGTRPTSSAIATAKSSTIPSRSRRKRRARSRSSTTSCSRICIPSCTAISTTSCGSTTTRRAETTKRAGTTSTCVGWLGYPMQLKINFLCRDSILAAPIVLDVALFLDLAKRVGFTGVQEWLSFYFKSPMHAAGLYPEHDLFIQLMKLKNTLRYIKGEELITHLGTGILRLTTDRLDSKIRTEPEA